MFAITGTAPKTVVFMHVNDTFGTAMEERHRRRAGRRLDMPYKIVETIAYDPAARDLSVEIAKAKATGADAADDWSAVSTTPSCSPAKWSSSAGRRWP